MKINIVMYHYVRDLAKTRYPNIKGLDTSLFRKQLEFLMENFKIVRMEDILSEGVVKYGNEGKQDNLALLTFDDGYIDHFTTVYPILDDLGIQGSFFPPSTILETDKLLDVNKVHFILASGAEGSIYETLLREIDCHRGMEFEILDTQTLIDEYAVPSRFDTAEVIFIKRMLQTVLPERLRKLMADKLFAQFVGVDEAVFAKELYCDESQLRTMKSHGMFIGIHGSRHEWLGNLKKSEYERDINHALGFMDSTGLIDKKSWVICYPYGSYNDNVVEYIRSNGCQLGLTTNVGIADLEEDDRLLLPRFDTNDFPPVNEAFNNG